MNIQITTSTFGNAGGKPVQYLREKRITFKKNPYERKLTEREAVEVIADAVGVIAGTEPLTRRVLDQLPNLRVISRCGTGLDNVDIEAAGEKGIAVLNTPDVHVHAVAELALAGTLSAMRRVARGDGAVRNGTWEKTMGSSLYGKQAGLIGFGKVARQFATLLSPFSMKISAYDPYVDPSGSGDLHVTFMELNELLATSDVVSLHLPFTDETRHIINPRALERCKPDVTLINTARGGLIDEEALFEFLKMNPDSYCYLDVFEEEPYTGSLRKLENILFTPHIGTTTRETREEMEYQAAVNLVNALQIS